MFKRFVFPRWEMVDFSEWLYPNYTSARPLVLPYLIDMRGQGYEFIYTAWDLDRWLPDPRPWYLGQTFQVIDGLVPDLPGLQVGLAPFEFNPDVGPDQDPIINLQPMSGIVEVAAEFEMIPEPATMGLFGLAGLLMVWRKR
jgi:hypothetical protein